MAVRKSVEQESVGLHAGKDELNLAEFPLCAIADRLDPAQKTLVFADCIWDRTRGGPIVRQLTITGSDAYGLPTALDDEVLLGLVQLSKLQQFAERKVPFTRYQLLRLLGWRDEGKSYERLEQSLNRWTGVTLYYQNAWWNKADRCWVSEKLHVLDNVTLVKPLRRTTARDAKEAVVRSSFVWNEAVFRSFQAGNLKRLDFTFYQSLKSAVARRLYRFLDKRFYRRRQWLFNVQELAWEHVGLARSYDVANLKRKLRPAIAELEARAFLRPMATADRFRKVRAGQWQVVFEKARTRLPAASPMHTPAVRSADLATVLRARGISAAGAAELVRAHSADRIQAQLAVFDWLVQKHDPKLTRNPAGFLVSAIQGDYAPPPDYVAAQADQRTAQRSSEQSRRRASRKTRATALADATEQQRRQTIDQFWQSLSGTERQRLEQEALSNAPAFQRELLAGQGTLATVTRQAILDAYAIQVRGRGVAPR